MPNETASPSPSPQRDTKSEPAVNVFAVHGVDPEVQAYAMAKYSRSALSMKESLKEISEQKAEQFLNTFYFQYGHRSIADLAHVAFAIEKLSILAAIILVDEQRWDGQERSTRYQNFKKSGYYVPDFAGDAAAEAKYRETCSFLFASYEVFSEGMFRWYEERTPRPAEMDQGTYDRTLKARAFDVARYLLPMATNTSLGQIVNARTLETQISRLLSSGYAEVRKLGELLKQASREPAYNANHARLKPIIEELRAQNAELASRAEAEIMREVRVSPTLVKYADPNAYAMDTQRELAQAAKELMGSEPPREARLVELLPDDPLELELAATLLYSASDYPYMQLREKVSGLDEARVREIVNLGVRHRGKHDELLRPFAAGQRFRFDILMDIGGFRDMHRHRRCIQVIQGLTARHGYETPRDLIDAGMQERYDAAMRQALTAAASLTGRGGEAHAHYLLPLAVRTRALFAMDFAEALYISELRTTEAGHFSYRKVAYEMYRAVARKHPALAEYFRVTDVNQPVDLLRR